MAREKSHMLIKSASFTTAIKPGQFKLTGTVALIILAIISTAISANAQGGAGNPTMLGGANTTATNDDTWTPRKGREGYFWRNPRAKKAAALDTLVPIPAQGNSGSDDQTNTDTIPDKTATDSTEPTQTPPSNSQVNAKQSIGPGGGSFLAMALVLPNSHPPYYQPLQVSTVTLPTTRQNEMFWMPMPTNGYILSDTQFKYLDLELKQRFLEKLFDPERMLWIANMWARISQGSVGNSLANTAQSSFTNATNQIMQPDGQNAGGAGAGGAGGTGGGGGGVGVGSLINVANDDISGANIANANSAITFWLNGGAPPLTKSLQDVVFMVQLLYKQLFTPIAILFLLPGAVITQMRAQITQGFNIQSDEAGSPFEGILRAMVALFLIPTTQLIVSYAIDIGNSLTYTVANYVQQDIILGWANELAYAPPPSMFQNAIIPATGAATGGAPGSSGSAASLTQDFSNLGGAFASGNIGQIIGAILGLFGNFVQYQDAGQGLGADQPATSVHLEQQSWLSQMLQMIFNVATTMFSNLIIIGTMFQLVFMCYLYLLGPLAAAFYAWPKIGQTLFKDVFVNWVNAVIQLSLWRFIWMVLLACMTQRLVYIQRMGEQLNLQWEIAVFACFVGLMFYIPTQMWNFDPGSAFTATATIGSSMVGGQGGQGGGMMGQLASQMKQQGYSAQQIQGMENTVQSVTVPMYQAGTQNYETNMAAHPGTEMNAQGAPHAQTGQPMPGLPGGSVQPTSNQTNGPRSENVPTTEPPVTTGNQTNNGVVAPESGTQVVSNYANGEMSSGPPPTSPIMQMASLSGAPTGGMSGFTGSPTGGTGGGLISSFPLSSGGENYSNPSDRGSFMPTNNNMTAFINPGVQSSPAALANFNQGVQSGAINSGNIGNLIAQMSQSRTQGPPPPPPPTMTA
jgi:hypothetical protein